MSGEKELSRVENDWNKVSAELDRLMGQFKHFESTEIIKYLRLSQQELRKMSPDECGEAAYLLHQEAMYLQLLLNELKTKMDWSKFHLDRIVGREIQQYDRFLHNDYKRRIIIDSDSSATEYQNIFNKAERLFTRLNYLPTQLKNQADVLLKYLTIKERQNYA